MKNKTIGLVMILSILGLGSASVLSSYGSISGKTNVNPPNLFPNNKGELNVNEVGSGSFQINDTQSYTFSHSFDGSKSFYNTNASVWLEFDSGSSNVGSVEFSYYGNSTFTSCTQKNSTLYECSDVGSSYDSDGFKLRLTASGGDFTLNLGKSSVVEVHEK